MVGSQIAIGSSTSPLKSREAKPGSRVLSDSLSDTATGCACLNGPARVSDELAAVSLHEPNAESARRRVIVRVAGVCSPVHTDASADPLLKRKQSSWVIV